jgi:hypothetical protein
LLRVTAAGLVLLICSIVSIGSSGLHCLSWCAAETLPAVAIEHDSQWNATIYKISSKDCTIEWIARNSEIGVIKQSAECAVSLSEQVSLLEKICAEFLSKDKNAQAFRTLFWGRLEPEPLMVPGNCRCGLRWPHINHRAGMQKRESRKTGT